jgi:hypothetical protein
MSNEITDFSKIQLREIFTKAGLNSDLTERAIKDYERFRESELSSLFLLSYNDLQTLGAEAITEEVFKLKQGTEVVNNILRDYAIYIDYKSQIAETYQKTKNWVTVFNTDVYSDVKEAQEAFIDYIEETYQIKIKDVKHLQELTGITHLNSWDEKLKDYKPVGEREAKENAIKELDETLTRARFSKFYRALERALTEGAKYKDLLQIDPKNYGLLESWSYCLASDQYSSVLRAISKAYFLSESFTILAPKPRDIAEDLEAPLSVIMDAVKTENKWKY